MTHLSFFLIKMYRIKQTIYRFSLLYINESQHFWYRYDKGLLKLLVYSYTDKTSVLVKGINYGSGWKWEEQDLTAAASASHTHTHTLQLRGSATEATPPGSDWTGVAMAPPLGLWGPAHTLNRWIWLRTVFFSAQKQLLKYEYDTFPITGIPFFGKQTDTTV